MKHAVILALHNVNHCSSRRCYWLIWCLELNTDYPNVFLVLIYLFPVQADPDGRENGAMVAQRLQEQACAWKATFKSPRKQRREDE